MNTEKFPKYIESVGQSKLLWFERSNSYVILPFESSDFLNCFLDANSETDFINKIIADKNISSDEAKLIFSQLFDLFESANTIEPDFKVKREPLEQLEIQEVAQTHNYLFENSKVKINYGSDLIESLFHPQLSHCGTLEAVEPEVVFDIFKKGGTLHLNKNNETIYSCPTNNYYLLQGYFAMELTNLMHGKNQEDWLATFHASTICNDKEAVMIVGASGNGKSTLTALLMASGLNILADDFTPFHAKDKLLFRYPNAISIKKGAFESLDHIQNFSELETYFNGTKQINVKYIPPSALSVSSAKCLPCNKIVYVKYSKDETPFFKKTKAKQILSELIPDSWISPIPEHAKTFMQWLKDLEYYELQYHKNDDAISSINSLF